MSVQWLDTVAQALAFVRQHSHGALHTDSRQVAPGDVFIAWPGAATDGRQHVPQALARGAAACLVERAGLEAFQFPAGAIAALPGLKAATGLLAAPGQAMNTSPGSTWRLSVCRAPRLCWRTKARACATVSSNCTLTATPLRGWRRSVDALPRQGPRPSCAGFAAPLR